MQIQQGKGKLPSPTDHPEIGVRRTASRVSSNVSMQLIHRSLFSIIKRTSHSLWVVGRSAFSEQELKAIIFSDVE